MSHAIRQDLSKLSKIIVFCLKIPQEEYINQMKSLIILDQKEQKGIQKIINYQDKDTPEGRVNFPTTETGDSQ